MRTPLFLLVLLPLLATSGDSDSGDVDPLTQVARSFFNEDFFYAHLKSDFVNASISPCDNFYRRICPTNFPNASTLIFKIPAEIKDITERYKSYPSLHGNKTIERIVASSGPDQTDYASVSSIASAVEKIPFESLVRVFSPSLIGIGGYNDLVRKKYYSNRTVVVAAIAHGMHSFMHKIIDPDFLKISRFSYFNESVRKFESVLQSERVMLNLAERLNHTFARGRLESVISNFLQEYLVAIKVAPWSSKEDRFGYSRGHLLAKFIGNISHTIAFANRFSIPDSVKEAISEKYIVQFVQMFEYFAGFAPMPQFRVLMAKAHAMQAVLGLLPRSYHVHFGAEPFRFIAQAHRPLQVILNQVVTLKSSFSSELASLIASTGYIFAHELYHIFQFAHVEEYAMIEDMSEYENARNCVVRHTDRVCSRFIEKSCASGYTSNEDAADTYGVQIAFRVMQKMLSEQVDEIIFPDLHMTHRQLFYHTIAVMTCAAESQWEREKENHLHNGWIYRANGMMGQLPDFKRTFGCYEDDRMVFPEESMCPAFSDELSRRKRK